MLSIGKCQSMMGVWPDTKVNDYDHVSVFNIHFLVAPLLKSGATYLLTMVSVGMCVCLFVCMYVCMYVCGQLQFNFKY